MDRNKSISWGQLDQITRMIEIANKELTDLWDNGAYRMTPEECKRLASYLTSIRISHSTMRDSLKLFEALLPAIIEGNKKRDEKRNLQKEAPILSTVGTD